MKSELKDRDLSVNVGEREIKVKRSQIGNPYEAEPYSGFHGEVVIQRSEYKKSEINLLKG